MKRSFNLRAWAACLGLVLIGQIFVSVLMNYRLALAETKMNSDSNVLANHYDPDISDGRIVWIDNRTGHNYVYLFDGTEERISVVTEACDPAISGDLVVWEGGKSAGDWQWGEDRAIYLYDAAGSGPETRISTRTLSYNPDIDGDYVVWQGGSWEGNQNEIYLYDIDTEEEMKISANTGCENPAISGEYVVWASTGNQRQKDNGIYLYNIEGETHEKISSITGACNPAISGDYVVFETPGGIYLYNIVDGEDPVKIADSEKAHDPSISQAVVIWEKEGDIHKYDIVGETTTLLCEATGTQSKPRIDSDGLVWEDMRDGNSDIYKSDLFGGASQVNADSYVLANHNEPDISGDRVVWTDDRTGHRYVYLKDGNTEKRISTLTESWNPAISGSKVVWQGGDAVYLYDVNAQSETKISTLTQSGNPDIDGNYAVWEAGYWGGYERAIHLYNTSTKEETKISANTGCRNPAISGNYVVWEGRSYWWQASTGIYLYDTGEGTQKRISARSSMCNPAISGGFVVFEAPDGIYLYDISQGGDPVKIRDSKKAHNPSISQGVVVWEENGDIYKYDILSVHVDFLYAGDAALSNPKIDGSGVVWEDYRNGNSYIYKGSVSDDSSAKINSDSFVQTNHYAPDIFGSRITWVDNGKGHNYVYLKDGNSSAIRISTRTESWNPAISENYVIWEGGYWPTYGLYLYDLGSQTETKISTLTQSSNPDIDGNYAVWQGGEWWTSSIYLYDISSKDEKKISTITGSTNPAISGNHVVWQARGNDYWDPATSSFKYEKPGIYLYDIDGQTQEKISSITGACNPVISGDRVAFQAFDGIYLYDADTKETTRICENNKAWNPSISQYIVTWEEEGDIYTYDIPAGKGRFVCQARATQRSPKIDGKNLVWEDMRDGSSDIYQTLMNLLSSATVESPNGGENLRGNQEIKWKSCDPDNEQVTYKIFISTDGGDTWWDNLHTESHAETSTPVTHSWNGFNTTGFPDGTECLIKITASDGKEENSDVSDNVFTIDNTAPQVGIKSGPTGSINNGNVAFTLEGTDNITEKTGLQYSYRLKANNNWSDWSSWSPETEKAYSLGDGAYVFQVKARDLAGNENSGSPAQREFTVDATAPSITSTAPADSATGISASANVTATFSEDVDPTSISASSFGLKDGLNNPVAGVVSYNMATKTATFDPDTDFALSTTYTATITSGVKDIAGNALTSYEEWSFTTEPPNTPVGTNVEVFLDTSVAITFSQITGVGNTNAAEISVAPPANFNFIGKAYNITTTASYVPPITISFSYAEADLTKPEDELRLFHYEGDAWVDVTTGIDKINNVVTGAVSSLSPFGLVEPINTAPPPVADFTCDKTTGDKPLTVNFTDSSTGTITNCLWDFGDGSTSTEKNPTHAYTSSGYFTVSLRVTGSGGSDIETKINYIYVTAQAPPPPTVLSGSTNWYFAEGYTGDGFDEWLTLQNPNSSSVDVEVTYMIKGEANRTEHYSVGPQTRATIKVNDAIGAGKEVSMHVSCASPIIAERPMYFNYMNKWNGGHNVIGATSSNTDWYFAEGYTGDGFDEWLTLQNPNSSSVDVNVTYMIKGEANQSRTYSVGPQTRATIKVNDAIGNNKEVSMHVSCASPIIAERPMYFNYMNKWNGGHNVIGATQSNTDWYFAEGYTGDGFDEWLTLQNPNSSSVDVAVTYMIKGEANQSRTYSVGPETRATIKVNDAIGNNKEVSMHVSSASPIIAERPMYFNYMNKWNGGHNVIGATASSTDWYFAEGYTGDGFDEWLTIQNPNSSSVDVEVTYMIKGEANQSRTYSVGPETRATIKVNDAIGSNKEVSMHVSCASPIIAERPMYFNYMNKWNGGHDVVGYAPAP